VGFIELTFGDTKDVRRQSDRTDLPFLLPSNDFLNFGHFDRA
jgi:hypothetical protein